jgi:hypothetical protein
MANPPVIIAYRSELFAANARGRFAEPRIRMGAYPRAGRRSAHPEGMR